MIQTTLIAAVAFLFVASVGNVAAQQSTAETRKNPSAVIAVERHWTQAEVHGDVGFVNRLLLPQYQSVNADGTSHPKSAILASALRNGKSDKMARLVAEYMKSHPYGTKVTIQGDAAVVTFYSLQLGPSKGVTSSDIFTYRAGRWYAVYSQHTAVKA